MQRDMNLVREILLALERHERGQAPGKIEIPPYSEEQIGFHVMLMAEARLIKAIETTCHGDPSPKAIPSRLTWEGYEFLAASKDSNIWEKSKKTILGKVGALSFEVLKAYLMYEVKSKLGLPG